MNTKATNINQIALDSLLAGVLPHIRKRIMKAYYLGASEGLEIANMSAGQAPARPTSNNSDLPIMLRVQAD